jgi:hypothetical protein
MFNCFNISGNDTERSLKLESYWAVLRDLPTEAIERTCLAAARGQIGKPNILPTAAQLYRYATRFDLHPTRPRAYALIDGKPQKIPPEERARSLELIRQLQTDLRMLNQQQTRPPKTEPSSTPEQRLEATAKSFRETQPVISEYLAKNIAEHASRLAATEAQEAAE